MNIQHFHGVPPLYTNTFLIITNAKHGIIIDAAAEPENLPESLGRGWCNINAYPADPRPL